MNSEKINIGRPLTLYISGVPCSFVYCEGGRFIMGSYDFRHDVEPPHEVQLQSSFWMQETLVTQKLWKVVTGQSIHEAMKLSSFEDLYGVGDDYPMYYITWHEAHDFCARASELAANMPKDYKLSLPTEAEWEYACRAHTRSPYYWGDSLNGDKANCNGHFPYGTHVQGTFIQQSVPVKSYNPNGFGLYDMSGNVWEWCEDWYDKNYYSQSPRSAPAGPLSGICKVIRGGGWKSPAECCRSAFRDSDPPDYRGRTLGMRMVLKPI